MIKSKSGYNPIDDLVRKENYSFEAQDRPNKRNERIVKDNIKIYNSRINMMILESILCYFKKNSREDFELITENMRANRFRYGYYLNAEIDTFPDFFLIDNRYFTGEKRLYIKELENKLYNETITLKALNKLYKLDMPDTKKLTAVPHDLTDNIVDKLCTAYKYKGILEDINLNNIMRCVDKGSLDNYSLFDPIINFLNSNNFDALIQQDTEHIEYYMDALKRHYKMVSSILEYRKYYEISHFEEYPSNFEEFKNIKNTTKNDNTTNTDNEE